MAASLIKFVGSSLFPYLAYLAALLVCGLVFWKGDRPLRLAALVIFVGWTLSPLVGHRNARGWSLAVTVLDTNIAILITWISMRWRRLWLATLAAFSILIVLAPIVFLEDRSLRWPSYAGANNVLAICQLVVLLVGLARTPRPVDEGAVRS